MVDVNTQADVKSFGIPVVPAVTMEDRSRPQVEPVKKTTNGESGSLDQKALHDNRRAMQAQKTMSAEELKKVAEEIQKRLETIGANLELGLGTDKSTASIVATISDRSSGTVVRQIPSEEMLALREKLADVVGLLFDQKA